MSPGNPVASWSILTLPLHAGIGRGGQCTSLANRGTKKEFENLSRIMCEKFGREIELKEEFDNVRNLEEKLH